MNANGSGQTQRTFDAELDSYPVWSPDGKFIAFRSDRAGNIEVFVMKADGSGPANRTGHAATDCHPTWKDVGGSAFRMVEAPATGGAIRPVTNRVPLGVQAARESACLGE